MKLSTMATAPKVPMRLSLRIASIFSRVRPARKASATSARPSSCRTPEITVQNVDREQGGERRGKRASRGDENPRAGRAERSRRPAERRSQRGRAARDSRGYRDDGEERDRAQEVRIISPAAAGRRPSSRLRLAIAAMRWFRIPARSRNSRARALSRARCRSRLRWSRKSRWPGSDCAASIKCSISAIHVPANQHNIREPQRQAIDDDRVEHLHRRSPRARSMRLFDGREFRRRVRRDAARCAPPFLRRALPRWRGRPARSFDCRASSSA